MRWILLSFDKQNRLLLSQNNKGQYMPSFVDSRYEKCSVTDFLSSMSLDSIKLHKLSELIYRRQKTNQRFFLLLLLGIFLQSYPNY